jgi:hypothetical protein
MLRHFMGLKKELRSAAFSAGAGGAGWFFLPLWANRPVKEIANASDSKRLRIVLVVFVKK